MEQIKQQDAVAYHWLRDTASLEHWARFKFDQTLKCPDNTNNFVEGFNHAILNFRGKPVSTMLEDIRKLVGGRFVKRFEKAQSWEGKVVPYVDKQLKLIEGESRNCSSIIHAGRGEFDVTEGKTNFTVRLSDRFCDCQRWQISGIPCKHVARCILRVKHKLEDYCDDCFKVENYRKLYDTIVHPISAPTMWESRTLPQLDTPYSQVKKGRPEEHMRRDPQPLPPAIGTTSFGSGTTR